MSVYVRVSVSMFHSYLLIRRQPFGSAGIGMVFLCKIVSCCFLLFCFFALASAGTLRSDGQHLSGVQQDLVRAGERCSTVVL